MSINWSRERWYPRDQLREYHHIPCLNHRDLNKRRQKENRRIIVKKNPTKVDKYFIVVGK